MAVIIVAADENYSSPSDFRENGVPAECKHASSKAVRKKRRSLVKIIASCVPNFLWKYLLPNSPRMFTHINFSDKISGLKQNRMDDSNSSFCTFRSYFLSKQIQPPHFHSTPKRDEEKENNKIQALQKELEEIKKQVAKLMEQHSSSRIITSPKHNSSGYSTFNIRENVQKTIRSETLPPSRLPPPPPPPPPPLPLEPLSGFNTPLKIEPKKKNLGPQIGFPCGKELLKDLKKVQLKKVEKSPGGGPIKKPKKVVNDPGEFLEAVLKRRFGLVQNSPESSLDSGSVDNHSFSPSNSYETQKNLVSTVT